MNSTIIALAIIFALLVFGIAIISMGSAPQASTTGAAVSSGSTPSPQPSPQPSPPSIAGVPYVPVYSGGGCAR